jgi:hypothetical protein
MASFLLLLFFERPELLFEVVDALVEFFVKAVGRMCHQCKPEVLYSLLF